jgi:hypothetical protein
MRHLSASLALILCATGVCAAEKKHEDTKPERKPAASGQFLCWQRPYGTSSAALMSDLNDTCNPSANFSVVQIGGTATYMVCCVAR